MGAGYHGGFGHTYGGSKQALVRSREKDSKAVSLPPNDAQIDHIFGNRPGHLPDTPKNRKKLVDLANDDSKYVGDDKYGNSWNAQIESDGSQTWVRYREGIINEGGNNITPRVWDHDTGYNYNPFKKAPPRGNNGKGPKDKGKGPDDKGDNNK